MKAKMKGRVAFKSEWKTGFGPLYAHTALPFGCATYTRILRESTLIYHDAKGPILSNGLGLVQMRSHIRIQLLLWVTGLYYIANLKEAGWVMSAWDFGSDLVCWLWIPLVFFDIASNIGRGTRVLAWRHLSLKRCLFPSHNVVCCRNHRDFFTLISSLRNTVPAL